MKILIVEDELVSRKKMDKLVQSLGHETFVATDGVAGLKIWRDVRPRIVITDWSMPQMDGIELCARIRSEEGEDYTYVIIVTAKDDVQDVIKGMDAGADDYIAKPFNKDELNVRIRAGERVINFQIKDIVIFALAKLAESRDEDTGNHLERVRHYSKRLAETILDSPNPPPELDRSLIDNVFLTSLLHDIGKVGIPDYILLKPGRLDDEEFRIMKTHSEIGYNTLNEALQKAPRAKYLQIAAEIARHHHEKYDGSGYPDGLKGDEIHLASRIFALSDVYDALVSKRPYKEAYSHDRAKHIIADSQGNHFDPMVVDAFLRCEKSFIEIHNKYKDDHKEFLSASSTNTG
jgi:putative two-component system response regulator